MRPFEPRSRGLTSARPDGFGQARDIDGPSRNWKLYLIEMLYDGDLVADGPHVHAVEIVTSMRRGEQAAIISTIRHSPRSGPSPSSTCSPRRRRSAACCATFGVGKGATGVILDMLMVPEAVIATLACARIGAIHSAAFAASRRANRRRANRPCDAKVDPQAAG